MNNTQQRKGLLTLFSTSIYVKWG